MKWSCVYESAYTADGGAFFPEKLGLEKLQELRRSQGVYIFANQYLNSVIPDDEQDFKSHWFKKYENIPKNTYTFCFIDPAISLSNHADYTATIIVRVDEEKNWYVTHAIRQRITATQTIEWLFKMFNEIKPMMIGIEEVAYQTSLIHFAQEEMLRRNQIIPIRGIKRSRFMADGSKKSDSSKSARIRSLVPRFEFGKIYLAQGLDDLVLELRSFPRGAHDDLLDALSSIEEIVFYPDKPKETKYVISPADPGYERQYINSLKKRSKENYD